MFILAFGVHGPVWVFLGSLELPGHSTRCLLISKIKKPYVGQVVPYLFGDFSRIKLHV